MITEKLNMALKQHLDTIKDSLDQKLSHVNILLIDFYFVLSYYLGYT